jgi:antitoxin HicB
MNTISFAYEYPVTLLPEAESGGYVVSFADFPEAITQGDTAEDALNQAEDCLEEAVANRIMMNVALPKPSPRAPDQAMACIPAPTAVKAAFYSAIRQLGVSKVQLAATLGVDEKEVRRLLDPYHPSKLNRIDELLRRLGTRLVIGFQEIGAVKSEAQPQDVRRPAASSTQWDAPRQNAGKLYVVASQSIQQRRALTTENQIAS